MKLRYTLTALLLLITQSGCMPMTYPPGAKNNAAQLGENTFLTEDGASLPLRHWLPKVEPRTVIIALHGFNDYSRFFDTPGEYFSKQGIACFAYDQRGFGMAPKRGLWAGGETYTKDLQTLVRLVKQRYPKRPVYLLGESMGGAIVITAMSRADMPEVSGIILAAPALWARSTMPWYQTGLLWTLAHSLPWLTLTGEGVHVVASDNIDMLRAMGRDPLVIKATRVETVYGLTDLMDAAFNSATLLRGNTLMLYGEKDEIIPKEPTYAFLQQFLATNSTEKTVAIYQHGYHMLLRDLQASTTWKDIAAWINASPGKLPSGADNRAKQLLSSR
ncbi:MAG: lysophospholipase [Methylobacter sp.]|uniref:alpha/beta hydrolase n=1 Tax=Methylobacter sp. TaxID=2051955 RepID=UPI0027321358|nr:alpha/beta hydrolase [Methylobacter sp.]MDP1664418.1 lysophospholipase [Methylobacter sp.]